MISMHDRGTAKRRNASRNGAVATARRRGRRSEASQSAPSGRRDLRSGRAGRQPVRCCRDYRGRRRKRRDRDRRLYGRPKLASARRRAISPAPSQRERLAGGRKLDAVGVPDAQREGGAPARTPIESPIRDFLCSQPACLAYAERMRARFFPELADAPLREEMPAAA
jgi:hypothetical protein